MQKALALSLAGIGLLAGCTNNASRSSLMRSSSSSSDTSATTPAADEQVAYGWSRPVTVEAFPEADQRLGAAESIIDGHSLRAIVTDAAVRIRGDDQACASCHGWASTAARTSFCERVPAFLELPTAMGDGHDSLSAKPLVLKELLERWHAAGCPD